MPADHRTAAAEVGHRTDRATNGPPAKAGTSGLTTDGARPGPAAVHRRRTSARRKRVGRVMQRPGVGLPRRSSLGTGLRAHLPASVGSACACSPACRLTSHDVPEPARSDGLRRLTSRQTRGWTPVRHGVSGGRPATSAGSPLAPTARNDCLRGLPRGRTCRNWPPRSPPPPRRRTL